MKRIGILVVCLILGMTITVSAVTHKVISASMKSQSIKYKGNTTNQEVIVYNNKTYVPLKSFSELVGVPVNYKNGDIYLGDTIEYSNTNNNDSVNNVYIGESKAKNIALQHAGVQESHISFTKLKLDKDDNRFVYEIEFYVGNKEYDYEINAYTGEIIDFSIDND